MSGSAEKEIHILIVDDQRDVAQVLRASLELTGRGYVITTVPSGEEALLETQRQLFDLAVVDYRLPGMTGLELVRRFRKSSSEMRVILITGYDIKEASQEVETLGISEILRKPLEPAVFTAVVERALGSDLSALSQAAVGDARLEPSPGFDEDVVMGQIGALQYDLGAMAVLLVDQQGNVHLVSGSVGADLHLAELAPLLAHNFATSVEVNAFLGDAVPSMLHYYDGSRYDVYTLSIGAHFFIAVLFPGETQAKMGPVMSFGRRTVKNILEAMGESIPSVEVEEAPDPAELMEAPLAVEEVAAEELVMLEPAADIDLEALDAAMETEIEDADTFWHEATKEETAAAEDTISLDEAIELGLIPEDLSSQE